MEGWERGWRDGRGEARMKEGNGGMGEKGRMGEGMEGWER